MTAHAEERREGSVQLEDGFRVGAGFRVATAGELLAGGPVELEFTLENLGTVPLRLAVTGDRMRQRPGQFEFPASFDSVPLEDPMAAAPNLGGPAGFVEIAPGAAWQQPLLLNQFVGLEQVPSRLTEGSSGMLEFTCRRRLSLAPGDSAPPALDAGPFASVDLAVRLHRDDAALEALAQRLLGEVVGGEPAARERALSLLLSLRAAAGTHILSLTRHPDPAIADRARHALER